MKRHGVGGANIEVATSSIGRPRWCSTQSYPFAGPQWEPHPLKVRRTEGEGYERLRRENQALLHRLKAALESEEGPAPHYP